MFAYYVQLLPYYSMNLSSNKKLLLCLPRMLGLKSRKLCFNASVSPTFITLPFVDERNTIITFQSRMIIPEVKPQIKNLLFFTGYPVWTCYQRSSLWKTSHFKKESCWWKGSWLWSFPLASIGTFLFCNIYVQRTQAWVWATISLLFYCFSPTVI